MSKPIWSVQGHACVVCGLQHHLTADNHDFHLLCGKHCQDIYNMNPLPYEVEGILFVMLRSSPAQAIRIQ